MGFSRKYIRFGLFFIDNGLNISYTEKKAVNNTEAISSKFGERLSNLRKDGGYTRTSFATKINMSQNTLRNYELGAREPGHTFLMQMALEFNVSIDYLLGLTDCKQSHSCDTSEIGLNTVDLSIARAYHNSDVGIQSSIRKLLDISDSSVITDSNEEAVDQPIEKTVFQQAGAIMDALNNQVHTKK